MIMLTVTKPRRKLRRILKGAGLLLLLLAVVPGLYYSLNSAGAMSMFASGTVQETEAENGAANGQPAGEQQPAAVEQENADDKLEEKPTEQLSGQSNTVQSEEVESDNAQLDNMETNSVQSNYEQPIDEQPEANGDKPGLGQRLRELIFGKEPEVRIYQNEN